MNRKGWLLVTAVIACVLVLAAGELIDRWYFSASRNPVRVLHGP
jgi:hypothetical protein